MKNKHKNQNKNNHDAPAAKTSPTVFSDSLEALKSDDLAPKVKKKANAGKILDKLLWGAVALALFGVFLYTGWLAMRDTVDFFKAQNRFDDIATEYSPITGRNEAPLLLSAGSVIYPLPDFEKILNGIGDYPDDPPDVPTPSLNSGGDPTVPDDPSGSDDPSSKDQPPEPDEHISEEKLAAFRSTLTSLQKSTKNNDVFAWIYIPGTNIDYPVVIAHEDNPDYYLTKGVDKQYNVAGSIFMDWRNERNLLANRFTVFYGHNIRQRGTMFNRLLEFKNVKTFEKYRYIYVYTESAALKYEIFSVYEDHGRNSPSGVITGFTDASFLRKITAIQERSLNERKGLTLKASDHVLMLYTCANTTSVLTDNDIRCMVFGVLVDVTT